jgi:DNA-binding Xre family transcriptional regulator
MIAFELNKILMELKISRTKFAKISNVRPNTINDMCNGITKRIEVETLENIMNALNQLSKEPINVADIINYEKDE